LKGGGKEKSRRGKFVQGGQQPGGRRGPVMKEKETKTGCERHCETGEGRETVRI